jgi:hypothetical protein
MPYISSIEFGSITIDNIKYDQVLIVGKKVKEREYEKLKTLFGTSHKIGDWELEELLNENPEIIIIGTGQDGALSVGEEVIDTINKKGIRLIIEKTPQAIITYNKKILENKKVNALVHTTC